MDPDKIKAALEAIKTGDADAALALLEEMVAAAAGGGEASDESGAEGDAAALAEGADPEPEEEEQMAAAALKRLARTDNVGAAIARLEGISGRLEKIEKERAKAEGIERRGLIADLVKLGKELPATAWEPEVEGQPRTPVKRLRDEPIDSLRERVEAYHAVAPPGAPRAPERRVDGGERTIKTPHGDVALSSRELKNCESLGVKPEDYAGNKAIREAARRGERV